MRSFGLIIETCESSIMRRRTLIVVSSIFVTLASFGACGWCLWEFFSLEGRPLGTFEIGKGRTIRIWSEQSKRDWLVGPVRVFYQVMEGRKEIVPTTYLGSD